MKEYRQFYYSVFNSCFLNKSFLADYLEQMDFLEKRWLHHETVNFDKITQNYVKEEMNRE